MSQSVEAAGAILYRSRQDFRGWMKFSDDGRPPVGTSPRAALDDLELCLVHRPKYDDWSWPKGKLENRETHMHAALREVGEETGQIARLGPYLTDVEYPLESEGRRSSSRGGRLKHIRYWMATPAGEDRAERQRTLMGPIHKPRVKEVDQIRWVSVQTARGLLTHHSDRAVLAAFIDRVDEGALNARQFIIVRHGKAVPRKEWTGRDADRPITPKGAAASYALARELVAFAPDLALSSPWVRCVQTLRPYTDEANMHLTTAGCLTESAFKRNPTQAVKWMDDQMADLLSLGDRTAMVCMHRPVLGGIFEHLRGLCNSKGMAKRLPEGSPFMPTGSAIVLSLTGDPAHPSIIDVQKVTPIVY